MLQHFEDGMLIESEVDPTTSDDSFFFNFCSGFIARPVQGIIDSDAISCRNCWKEENFGNSSYVNAVSSTMIGLLPTLR